MNASTIKVVNELAMAYLDAYHITISGSIGINKKTNTNTLKESNLYKDASVQALESGNDIIVNLLLNDYEVYVENGRKSNKFPPVEPIVRWAKRKGLPTDNSTIFLIRRSIAEKGIQPRPFMNTVFQDMEQQMDSKFYDKLLESIITDLTKYFED